MSGERRKLWLSTFFVNKYDVLSSRIDTVAASHISESDDESTVIGERYCFSAKTFPSKGGWTAPHITATPIDPDTERLMLCLFLEQYGLAPTDDDAIVRLDADGNATDECVATKRSEK